MSDYEYLKYRLRVLRDCPESAWKRATQRAIRSRLRALKGRP